MERTLASLAALRTKMIRAGVSQEELARAASMHQPNISAILNGKAYCSRARAIRLQDALHALAAQKAAERAAATEQEESDEPETVPPQPRVRRL